MLVDICSCRQPEHQARAGSLLTYCYTLEGVKSLVAIT